MEQHLNGLRDGYNKQLNDLISRESLLKEELKNVGNAIQQYQGALKALDQVHAGLKVTQQDKAKPATPVSSTPAPTAPEAPATPATPEVAPAAAPATK